MDKSLSHLPKEKQDELSKITDLIAKNIQVEKIILFGSFARGDWVSDSYKEGHIVYEYKSDYDLLVVVKSEVIQRDVNAWNSLNEEIRKSKLINTPVNLVVDTIHFVNQKIAEGNYFYVDIKREGITLYDSGRFKLLEPVGLSPENRKALAESDFNFWYSKFRAFIKDYKHNLEDNELNNAAFHLSQAVESLYFAVLLVFTGYKPKSHNIEKIEELVTNLAPTLRSIYPKETPDQIRIFELLKRAYIDARYKKDYKITVDELDYLMEKTASLEEKVISVCQAKIQSFI